MGEPNDIAVERATQARLQEVLAQTERPEFVESFEVHLDHFDDEPAAWVTLQLSGSDELGIVELKRRAKVLFDFQEIVKERLSAAGIALWTFFPITYVSNVRIDRPH